MSVKITVDRLHEILNAVKHLSSMDVYVGVPESAGEHDGSEISNAQLAYLMDKGSPANNIPARPFLYEGIADAQKQVADQLGKAAEQALDGHADKAETFLNAAGLVAQNAVKNRITEGDFAPLKPATIKARKRQGFAGTKPLVHTGQLRNSITYVVTKKGGK